MAKKKSKWRYLRRLVIKLGIFSAFVWAMFTFVFGWCRATGNNMFPMIKDGDFVLFFRLEEGYYLNDPVVFRMEDGQERIGRVVAIEGQTIEFPEEGGYLVDGSVPSESLPYETYEDEDKLVRYPLTIGHEEYFILNDYRTDTKDSRRFNVIKKSDVLGKAIFILRRRSV